MGVTAQLSDEEFFRALQATRKAWGVSMSWDVAEYLNLPWKLVLSKARKMISKGQITGCACGCRGDWQPVDQEGRDD